MKRHEHNYIPGSIGDECNFCGLLRSTIERIEEKSKEEPKEIKKGESYRKGFLAGVAEENFAWRSHKRCSICGEKMKPQIATDICNNCFKGKDSPSLATANSQKKFICHAGQFHEIGCFCNKAREMLENNGT